MTYLAIMNIPGYLPEDDEPAEFEDPADAWSYLADTRRSEEDESEFSDPEGADVTETNSYYSDTVHQLDAYASANHGPDTVYGPVADGRGFEIAYCVTESEE